MTRLILIRFIVFLLFFCLSSRSTAVLAEESFFLFDVSLPITSSNAGNLLRALEQRIIALAGRHEDVTVILRMTVPESQENFGRGSSFGVCFELANLISGPKFVDIRTVAYFPRSVNGHAILVALACDEILLAPDAEIGLASVDEPQLNTTMVRAYEEIAGRRSNVATAIVRKMLDPNIELLQVEGEHGTQWISTNELKDLRDRETLTGEPAVISSTGQPGLFTAEQARNIGLVSFLVGDFNAVCALFKIVPAQTQQVSIRGNHGRAVRVDLTGPMTDSRVAEVQRSLSGEMEPKDGGIPADFICLWIDSPGGNIVASQKLAAFLTHDVGARVVAYVPNQARSDAAIVALACDEVVLGPKAVLGGDGATAFSKQQISDAVETLATSFSQKSRRHWSLLAAMIDPDQKVDRFSLQEKPATVAFFSEREWKAQPNPEAWVRSETVHVPGKIFSVIGEEGIKYWLVDKIANDFDDFKKLYHLENDPTLVKPGWADQFVRALAAPGFAALLIFAGFIGVMIELKTPGLGIGAVVAMVCFALFFWSRYLGGTAGWLEIILLVSGIVFILLEIFVIPGFGAFGIIGGLCVITSIVLASQTFIIPQNSYQYAQLLNSGLILVISGTGMLVVAATGAHWIHEQNKPQDTELIREMEKLAHHEHLRGKEGKTSTLLVPSGRAMIDGELVDVTTEGDVIDIDTPIIVADIRGYKVIVKKKETKA